TVTNSAGASSAVRFTVAPIPPPGLTFYPNKATVVTGQSETLRLVLNPVPSDPGQISISAGSAVISAPSLVSFSSGQAIVTFSIFGNTPGTTDITATFGGSSSTANIDVQNIMTGSFQMSSNLVRIINLDAGGLFGAPIQTFSNVVRITNLDSTN